MKIDADAFARRFRADRATMAPRTALVWIAASLALWLGSVGAAGCEAAYAASPASAETPLYAGIGVVRFKASTGSTRALKYFQQGLAFNYAFNHEEAERSFVEASKLDPGMAMAYWGAALVAGPNYNMPPDSARANAIAQRIAKARSLENSAMPMERDLIEAIARRYTANGASDAAHDTAYANAMRVVAARHADNPDVQVLFAESLMDLNPWQLWTAKGEPTAHTEEILSTLEAVLRRYPNHAGANHYYIHAAEASPDPGRALASAQRLGTLAPAAGHLVHMPSHIYLRLGRYQDAAATNEAAIKVDRKFLAESGETGAYAAMYYPHNIHFLCYALMMEGRYRDALGAARSLKASVPAATIREMPMAEFVVPYEYLVMARFADWDKILQGPPPARDFTYGIGMWRYARGIAFASRGQVDDAQRERRQLRHTSKAVSPDLLFGQNRARDLLRIADLILTGEIAAAGGSHRRAIANLTQAVAAQDGLIYDEPPPWYYPARESLARELLLSGRPIEAESVAREDLRRNPRNPRSIYYLAGALRMQKKNAAAAAAEADFKQAWSHADVALDDPAQRVAAATDR